MRWSSDNWGRVVTFRNSAIMSWPLRTVNSQPQTRNSELLLSSFDDFIRETLKCNALTSLPTVPPRHCNWARFALKYCRLMSPRFRPYVSLVLFALFTASSLWAQKAQVTPEQKLDAAAEVLQQLDAGAADVEVIVSLVEPAGKPREKDWDSRPKL